MNKDEHQILSALDAAARRVADVAVLVSESTNRESAIVAVMELLGTGRLGATAVVGRRLDEFTMADVADVRARLDSD